MSSIYERIRRPSFTWVCVKVVPKIPRLPRIEFNNYLLRPICNWRREQNFDWTRAMFGRNFLISNIKYLSNFTPKFNVLLRRKPISINRNIRASYPPSKFNWLKVFNLTPIQSPFFLQLIMKHLQEDVIILFYTLYFTEMSQIIYAMETRWTR